MIGRDTWPLLKITDPLLDQLRRLGDEGVSTPEMIEFLHAEGVTKPGAILALRLIGVMPSSDTKQAVHCSDAYAHRRKSDEAFEESLVSALNEIEQAHTAA